MADFPRVKYKVIDGRSVPFTEPQHFVGNGDETVRTGESNPLPTKDGAVEARLESIEQTQSQILAKLNDTIDTRLTGSIVEQGIKYRSPETTVVFNEPIEGTGELKTLLDFTNIPENVQSIGISMRKNSETSITTQYSYRQGNDIIFSKINNWDSAFQAIIPVIGDSLRLRVMEMSPSTRPVFVAVTYFFAPQEQRNTEDDSRLDNLENALTSLGGSI